MGVLAEIAVIEARGVSADEFPFGVRERRWPPHDFPKKVDEGPIDPLMAQEYVERGRIPWQVIKKWHVIPPIILGNSGFSQTQPGSCTTIFLAHFIHLASGV